MADLYSLPISEKYIRLSKKYEKLKGTAKDLGLLVEVIDVYYKSINDYKFKIPKNGFNDYEERLLGYAINKVEEFLLPYIKKNDELVSLVRSNEISRKQLRLFK